MSPDMPALAVHNRTYFFLSYADGGPMADSGPTASGPTTAEPDPVQGFFSDLSAAVARHASQADPASVGFYDQNIPIGADRTTAMAEAIGSTEVLVPLYSPRYLKRSWPKPELEWFRDRLSQAGVADPDCHIVPVLWTPLRAGLAPDADSDVDVARSLGQDSPEYLAKGMRALLLTERRGGAYQRIMDRLAQRIVECAEGDTVLPRATVTVARDDGIPDADVRFVVAVVTPSGEDWRPFASHSLLQPAQHAADVAARLGLSPRIGRLDAVRELLDGRPAIVLIDPGVIAAPGAPKVLASLTQLPRWVMPMIVRESDDRNNPESDRRAARIIRLLETQDGARVRVVRRMEEFVESMPHMITRARARYLKLADFSLPDDPPPVPRMSLRFDPPTTPTQGENR